MMELAEILEGARGTVVAYVDPRDGCIFLKELEALVAAEDPLGYRILHCIEEWCERGKPGYSSGVWRRLSGTNPCIEEWRLWASRVFWHRDGRRLLVSELTAKQGRKENRAISRAERLAERYRNENRLGNVRIVKLD